MASVVVFGPTGAVGSVTARTAQEKGAKVVLAMRDTKKSIPGLSAEQEKSGGFQRVQADLSDPDSCAAAVKSTGAKRVFVYLAHGTPDHMKATLEALKSAGVELVVFLSSYTIDKDPKDVPSAEIIPFVHAQVEINLDEVFGPENYVAVRPGSFSSNLLRFKGGAAAGNVELYSPDFEFDYISTVDIGRVGGAILAEGPKNDQHKLYLYGPQIVSQRAAVDVIAKVLDKPITTTVIGKEKALNQFLEHGFPRVVSEYVIRRFEDSDNGINRASYQEGVDNVKLYTGEPSTPVEEWVRANKHLFSS